jgi:hypothetical protein
MSFVQSPYNQLTGLIVENFRTFARRQEIPIRPITLLYGPNSSGKSTILRALKWINQIREGDGLNSLPRLLHRFDSTKQVRVGYEIATSPCGGDCPRGWLGSIVRAVKVEAAFATSDHVQSVARQFFVLSEAAEQFGVFPPQVSNALISVNGAEFLRMEMEIQDLTGERLGIWRHKAALRVADIAAHHPLFAALLAEAQRQARQEVGERTRYAVSWQHIAARSGEVMQRFQISLQKNVDEIQKIAALLNDFDIASISPDEMLDAAQELSFVPGTFPPNAVVQDRPIASVQHQISQKESISFSIPRVLMTPKALVLEHFKNLLAIATHWLTQPTEMNLANDPIGEMILIPTLRSIPAQPFIISDPKQRSEHAPDWPAANFQTFERANAWLESLRRPDTAYALRSEPTRIYSGGRDDLREEEHLRFIGVHDLGRDVIVNFDELGAGFSQLVPILLAAFNNEDSTVLIEQPELHLHPALQAELADLFALTISPPDVDDDSRHFKQYIIETHSEHLLLRLMRRIRNTTKGEVPPGGARLRATDVAVLYVESQGDHSTVSEMPLNEEGELIRDWPGGFFEEGLRELLL